MNKVNSIPEGFSTVTPYLVVKDATKAIEFYKAAFGAEELYRSTCDTSQRIMNAKLRIGNSMIMLNDEFPEHDCLGPAPDRHSPVTIHLYVDDVDEVYDRAVAAGAEPVMPVADAFWGDRFGQVRDPFGHNWSMATHVKDMTAEEIEKQAKRAFS